MENLDKKFEEFEKRVLKKLKLQGDRQDDMRGHLDTDRETMDGISDKVEANTQSIETLKGQMTDFKKELRQMILDILKEDLPELLGTAVNEKLDNIAMNNPRKSFIIYYGLPELLKNTWGKITRRFKGS